MKKVLILLAILGIVGFGATQVLKGRGASPTR